MLGGDNGRVLNSNDASDKSDSEPGELPNDEKGDGVFDVGDSGKSGSSPTGTLAQSFGGGAGIPVLRAFWETASALARAAEICSSLSSSMSLLGQVRKDAHGKTSQAEVLICERDITGAKDERK